MTITLEQADTGTARAAGEIERENAETAANEKLGATMVRILDDLYGEGRGRAFRDSIIKPTHPGTEARKRQDKQWSTLTIRLRIAAGEES